MKQMIIRMFVMMLLAIAATCAMAQPEEDITGKGKEKIAALKRAFITEKLDLTSEEAEKFWPVFNAYEKKKDGLKKEIRQLQKKSETDSVSIKDATVTIDLINAQRKAEVDLDSQFLKDCLPILGASRTMHLAKLEREFQRTMMQKIKEKRQDKLGPGPRKSGMQKKG